MKTWNEWYRLIQPSDLLDPEMEHKLKAIPEGLFKNIQKKAHRLLIEQPDAPECVKQHWQSIVEGLAPYGLQVIKRSKHAKYSSDVNNQT